MRRRGIATAISYLYQQLLNLLRRDLVGLELNDNRARPLEDSSRGAHATVGSPTKPQSSLRRGTNRLRHPHDSAIHGAPVFGEQSDLRFIQSRCEGLPIWEAHLVDRDEDFKTLACTKKDQIGLPW